MNNTISLLLPGQDRSIPSDKILKSLKLKPMRFILTLSLVFILSACGDGLLTKKEPPAATNPKAVSRVEMYPTVAGMALVPGGWFNMGSENADNEKPVHRVYIDDFYMDETEVTVAQFREFTKATRRKMPRQPSWNRGNHPVVNVTWKQAAAYARWAGKRLPTEAEWEYAARGGQMNYDYVFQGSRGYGKNYENIADESMRRVKFHFPVVEGYDDGYVYTAPVASYPPNRFGLYDLNGNVLEWVADWYADRYQAGEQRNPRGPQKGFYRSLRGASWNRSGKYMRASYRSFFNPGVRFEFIGFRCARDAQLPISSQQTPAAGKIQ